MLIPLVQTIVIVIGTETLRLLLKTVINNSIAKLNSHKKIPSVRLTTIASVLKNILRYVLWTIAGTMILSAWKINVTPIIAGAGVIGLAVGFGTQSLVRDVVTGVFLLFENYLNIGDRVKVAGVEGKIVSVKLRTTILKEDNGTTHIVPNSLIAIITKLP